MKLEKAKRRDKKRRKKRYGHKVGSRSVFKIIEILRKRGKK